MPKSTLPEVAADTLVAAIGVVYLLVGAVNGFGPMGVGAIVYPGASEAGTFVVNGAGRISSLLLHT